MEYNKQAQIDFDRIAAAINYMKTHFKEQPKVEAIAKAVHLSPTHFSRLFSEWAGTSPKRFLQFISISHARRLLQKPAASLFDISDQIGLSSTSRLHELFVQIEAMTPGEYKKQGAGLEIAYSFADTPFGPVILGATAKGICYMTFIQAAQKKQAVAGLQAQFMQATLIEDTTEMHQKALAIFDKDPQNLSTVKLHLRGTPFQLKVWESLLKIPMGQLSTYGTLASQIGHPKASRAVGTAIGSNPVAYLIPCHRVIQASGQLGGYMWGTTRKTAMIGWESAQTSSEKEG